MDNWIEYWKSDCQKDDLMFFDFELDGNKFTYKALDVICDIFEKNAKRLGYGVSFSQYDNGVFTLTRGDSGDSIGTIQSNMVFEKECIASTNLERNTFELNASVGVPRILMIYLRRIIDEIGFRIITTSMFPCESEFWLRPSEPFWKNFSI